jgi:hypothetical protein
LTGGFFGVTFFGAVFFRESFFAARFFGLGSDPLDSESSLSSCCSSSSSLSDVRVLLDFCAPRLASRFRFAGFSDSALSLSSLSSDSDFFAADGFVVWRFFFGGVSSSAAARFRPFSCFFVSAFGAATGELGRSGSLSSLS